MQLAKLPDSKFSLMLVRAGEKMGKTWLLRKMERHSRDVLRLPITHVDFRHPRDASQVSDFLGLIRLLRDRFEQPEAFVALNATIRQFTDKKPVGSGVFITNLSDKFVERFTFATLDYLARRIGIRYDNIPARDNTLSSKALAFVTMAFEGQLMELLFVALEKKSAEDGYNLPPNYWREGYAELFPQAVTGQAQQADNYAPIRFTTPLEYENAQQQIT
ncbi:MAG TPA: hypothetical protein ENJ56_00010, partial [Anaerolineae bacterium]|nr:hypothetical protein [Anaerolineae bacterium]